MVSFYFAYGSNMNPVRVSERGMQFDAVQGGRLEGFRLVFDKASKAHPDIGHANLTYDPAAAAEGVVYRLTSASEITRMDPYENAPVNYSREVVTVAGVHCWTYFANPAVRFAGLKPSRSYLNHLLAGREYLTPEYYRMLCAVECVEGR